MSDILHIRYDNLPPSNNKYLMPSCVIRGGKAFPSLYESKESKAFKSHFRSYLKQVVKNADWDIEKTAEGHWYLDCMFVQTRTNQDSNNFFKVLLDSMTGIVFEDDSNILVRVQKVSYNPKKPHFKLALHKAKYVGLFDTQDGFDEFESSCKTCSRYRNGSCSILKSISENREVEELQRIDSKYICEKYKRKQ